jgi:hypothetical protein
MHKNAQTQLPISAQSASIGQWLGSIMGRGTRIWRAARRLGVWLAGACAVGANCAWAAPSGIDFSTYRPTTPATRIETSESPKLDGDLSDPAWQKASIIDKFYQLEPHPGEPGTERTLVRVLYDKNALYVSFYCYDSDPKNIPLGAKTRDTNVNIGDFVRLYLDPGLTRRNAYDFEVNALGGRADALIPNNYGMLYEWNTIWAAKTKRVDDGWTVEIMIPFRSISYQAGGGDWGLDLYRRMYRVSERVRWTSANPSISVDDISHEGTLTGITDITQGMGLDIQTYASVRFKHEWAAPSESDVKFAGSGNLYYKLTPALTGTLTVNPDFSNTPLDQRRINTTRFALFYPETRDFFLQDAPAFEFGGRPFEEDSNGMPFFSRNVGLVDGVPVPIRLGSKVSGTLAGWNLGAFSALADGLGLKNRQILSVMRAAHPVLAESKVGIIFTNGDPTGNSNNSVFGTDFQYRNSHLPGGKILNVHAAFLRSKSSTSGVDDEHTLAIQYPNEPWYGRLVYRQIGGDFTPALGFVNRTAIRDYVFNAGRLKRITHSWIRWFDIGSNQSVTTDIGNRLQSFQGSAYLGIQNLAGDTGYLNIRRQIEIVPAAFSLGGPASVPPGTYRWNYVNFNLNTTQRRPIFFSGDITCCDFYDGRALQIGLYSVYHPGTTWEFIPQYSAAYIDLPTGSVSIHVGVLGVNLNFTPDMQLKTETQYDNLSQTFSFSARYRWEYSPGSEFFAAAGEQALITKRLWHSHYASQTTQASIRIGHTLRF